MFYDVLRTSTRLIKLFLNHLEVNKDALGSERQDLEFYEYLR